MPFENHTFFKLLYFIIVTLHWRDKNIINFLLFFFMTAAISLVFRGATLNSNWIGRVYTQRNSPCQPQQPEPLKTKTWA